MKKFLLVAGVLSLSFSLLFTAMGCGAEAGSGNTNLEGTLEEILEKIYEEAELSDDFRSWAEEGLMIQTIDADNEEYHLGKTGITFGEAIASEPMMMPSAYALCLIKAEEGQDVEALKTEIKASANPYKWVCVGVEDENVLVGNVGDIVMLVMSNENAQALMDAFKGLQS